MVKNYNENAFNELVNTINKHIDGDSSALPVLVDMITELDKKYPMLKNKFIHDMGSFMTHWFNLINDSKSCSLILRAKTLNIDFVTRYSAFKFNYRFLAYFAFDDQYATVTPKLEDEALGDNIKIDATDADAIKNVLADYKDGLPGLDKHARQIQLGYIQFLFNRSAAVVFLSEERRINIPAARQQQRRKIVDDQSIRRRHRCGYNRL